MKNQWQHLTEAQRNEWMKWLQYYEDFFDGTLGTRKIDPVDLELKEDKNDMLKTISRTKGTRRNVQK